MIFLCMMCFVENQEIYLVNADERMHETLIQDLCCTNNDHVLRKVLVPDAFLPKFTAHVSAEAFDLLV